MERDKIRRETSRSEKDIYVQSDLSDKDPLEDQLKRES